MTKSRREQGRQDVLSRGGMFTSRSWGRRIDWAIRGANTLRKAKLFEVLCKVVELLSKQKVDR